MIESRVFKKVLTPAEVGNTGTHEKYIRLTNDFDFESFFQQSGTINGTVKQIDFKAKDLTIGFENEDLLPFKFVYYENSNGEKRLPSLAPLYESHNVHEGDIIVLESRTENGSTSFYFTLHKAGEVVLKPATIFYTETLNNKYITTNPDSNNHLQQIFYGAPGTGKSHEIDQSTNEDNRIRTTFHPDYDYASFVGCYKPTKESWIDRYNVDELVKKLNETKNSGTTYPCQKFATKYWKSLRDLNQTAIKELLTKAGFSETFNVEVSKGIAVGQELSQQISNSHITYAFTPQAFIKAYVEAWRRYCQTENTDKDFYLIIEEINRGNCAQIFGDLFQLLDRTSTGFSRYSVETESDLQRFLTEDETFKLGISLKEDITDDNGKVIASAMDVMSGKVLVLPPNFHIWATMNTSDQSLFPIDSAFKRRWDWKYMPIKYSNKDWKVVLIGNTSVEWVKLQQKLNDLIYDATESEDKMLGDWFVKADTNNVISEEVLVGKIIFYLWNDVAKVDAGKLFDLEIEKHGRKCKVTFSDFYNNDGKINSEVVKKWLKQIDVLKEEPSGERQDTSDNEASPATSSDTNQE